MTYDERLLSESKLATLPLPPPTKLLSDNHKTGASLNLPLTNCHPTERCAEACYARIGPIAWPNSVRKALAVDATLRKSEIDGLAWECRRLQDVRLNGSGDMIPEHISAVLGLAAACPKTMFWGFTRKRKIAERLNRKLRNLSLIISFDVTSPDEDLTGYEGPLAFGPRRPEDPVPDDERIVVVFPEHHLGHTIPGVPPHPKDCPATRGMVRLHACQRCQRCWKIRRKEK